GGDDSWSLRTELGAPHGADVSRLGLRGGAVIGIIGVIRRGGGRRRPYRPPQDQCRLSSLGIPDARSFVFRSGEDAPSIATESRSPHDVLMALEDAKFLACVGIPQPRCAIR